MTVNFITFDNWAFEISFIQSCLDNRWVFSLIIFSVGFEVRLGKEHSFEKTEK